MNLTNHSYFNLSGVPGSDVLDQLVMINADNYTPVDSTLIPVGISPVDGTPLDLRTPVAIGKQINNPFQQLQFGRGYDLNWVLNTNGDKNVLAAKAYSPTSGTLWKYIPMNRVSSSIPETSWMEKILESMVSYIRIVVLCVLKHSIIRILPTIRISQV